MTTSLNPNAALLSDDELLASVTALACAERRATAALVAALVELDRRKLFLGLGYPSLFAYCTQVLRLSEHAAYNRIEAVRAVARLPAVLDHLADGAITLTTVCLLGPLLTEENHQSLLKTARHQSRREVERLVATLRPRPDVPASVRKLPAPRSTGEGDAVDHVPGSRLLLAPTGESDPRTMIATATAMATGTASGTPALANRSDAWRAAATRCADHAPFSIAPGRPAVTVPLAPDRYKIQFTATDATYRKLERARALLRHGIPTGDVGAIFDRALDTLLADIAKKKLAATEHPRHARRTTAGSRHIPAAVRRAVWQRDGARCAFAGAAGRCAERNFLELHHVVPFATGGEATVENIQLRCRAHNVYESEQVFGRFILRERPPAYQRC